MLFCTRRRGDFRLGVCSSVSFYMHFQGSREVKDLSCPEHGQLKVSKVLDQRCFKLMRKVQYDSNNFHNLSKKKWYNLQLLSKALILQMEIVGTKDANEFMVGKTPRDTRPTPYSPMWLADLGAHDSSLKEGWLQWLLMDQCFTGLPKDPRKSDENRSFII